MHVIPAFPLPSPSLSTAALAQPSETLFRLRAAEGKSLCLQGTPYLIHPRTSLYRVMSLHTSLLTLYFIVTLTLIRSRLNCQSHVRRGAAVWRCDHVDLSSD